MKELKKKKEHRWGVVLDPETTDKCITTKCNVWSLFESCLKQKQTSKRQKWYFGLLGKFEYKLYIR